MDAGSGIVDHSGQHFLRVSLPGGVPARFRFVVKMVRAHGGGGPLGGGACSLVKSIQSWCSSIQAVQVVQQMEETEENGGEGEEGEEGEKQVRFARNYKRFTNDST